MVSFPISTFHELTNMTDEVQKRLTVTFRDVAVQVASLGESYGSTVASVVMDLVPSFKKQKQPLRVRFLHQVCVLAFSAANMPRSTYYKGFPVKYGQAKW